MLTCCLCKKDNKNLHELTYVPNRYDEFDKKMVKLYKIYMNVDYIPLITTLDNLTKFKIDGSLHNYVINCNRYMFNRWKRWNIDFPWKKPYI